MRTRMVILLVGCVAVALLLRVTGIAGMYLFKTKRDALSAVEFVKVGEAGERAHAAYRHASAPVAISALSEYLLALQEAEKLPAYRAYMPAASIRFDMAVTHARLARLYAQVNQPELSTQHEAQALACVHASGRGSLITNWPALEAIVTRLDHAAKD